MRTSRLTGSVLLAVALAAVLTGVLVEAAASRVAASKGAGTIAFMRLLPGPGFGARLFVVGAEGSGLRRLTPRSTTVWSYAWSPNGRLIAYIDKRFSLWLVRPDGTGRRLLLPTSQLSSTSLSWSPDGKEIAIASPGPNAKTDTCRSALYVVPINGGQPVSLHAGVGCDVAWSPRGDEIAYDRGGGIFVIHADGTGRHQISTGGGVWWSADGAQLASDVGGWRHGAIDHYRAFAVVDANGKDFHVVTTHAYNEYGVAWSPQGRQILYGGADRKGIYVIDADGQNNHRVTRDSPPRAEWGALAWSPNGGSIVYDTGTYDNTDLYVIGADGRGKVQLTSTPGIDIDPSWEPK